MMKNLTIALIALSTLFPIPALSQNWGNLLEKGLDILEDQVNAPPQHQPPAAPPAEPPAQPRPAPQSSPTPAAPPSVTTTTAPQPTPPPAPGHLNSNTARVAEAQQLLNRLGYDVGPVDGLYGRKTQNAILAFERDFGRPARGDVTDQLIDRIAQAAQQIDDSQVAGTETTSLSQPSVAPAPAAPAASGPAAVKAAAQQDAGSLSGLPGGVDPLAPFGVELRTSLVEAAARLAEAGWQQDSPCVHSLKLSKVKELMVFNENKCADSSTITAIKYTRKGTPRVSWPINNVIDGISNALGGAAHCPKYDSMWTVCLWKDHSRTAQIGEVKLGYLVQGADFQYSITASQSAAAEAPPALAEFDLVAPGGLSLGLPMAGASLIIEDHGYDVTRQGAGIRKAARSFEELYYYPDRASLEAVQPAGVIGGLKYELKVLGPPPSGQDLVALVEQRVGAAENCGALKEGLAICRWTWPERAPLIKELHLTFQHKNIWIPGGDRGAGFELEITQQASPSIAQEIAAGTAADSTASSSAEQDGAPAAALPGDLMDPIAPFGIVLGTRVRDAGAALVEMGFTDRGRCRYRENEHGGLAFNDRIYCTPDDTIESISYGFDNIRPAASITGLVERINRVFGAVGSCPGQRRDYASCTWQSPPAASSIARAYLEVREDHFYYFVQAVPGLDLRQPVSQQNDSQSGPWWEIELAGLRSRQPSYENQEGAASLSPEQREQFSQEAEIVLTHCRKDHRISALRDCVCLAERFHAERVQRLSLPYGSGIGPAPGSSEHRHYILNLADSVAEACPNRAGAADYGYQQCVRQTQRRLPTNYQEFCRCYAEKFSALYMENPLASFPATTRLGSASMMSCSEQISPNPLGG